MKIFYIYFIIPLLINFLYAHNFNHNSEKTGMDNLKQASVNEQNEQPKINLPQPRHKSDTSVEEALLGRRSVRTYKNEPLTLAEISQLLWAAYGITQKMDSPGFLRGGLRTVPSAGALYPLEIYVVTGNVSGLGKGVYKYHSQGHYLIKMLDGDKRSELCAAAWGQEMIKEAAVVIVYSAIFERTTKKYGARGRERYVYKDVGHSAQNIYLQAYALNIGMCVCGSFNDKKVKEVLKLSAEETPLYLIPVGKK